MISAELHDVVRRFVDAEFSIGGLEDWLAPRLPLFLQFPHSPDARVVGAIELALAEYSDGMRDEASLRSYLRQALARHTPLIVDWQPRSS